MCGASSTGVSVANRFHTWATREAIPILMPSALGVTIMEVLGKTFTGGSEMATLNCGHAESAHDASFTTGYATERDTGRKVCYGCAAAADVGQIVNTGRGMAYLSSDGHTLTTWPGLVIGTVSRTSVARSRFGGSITRVWASIGGTPVYGMGGGAGMAVSLKRVK